MIDQKSEQVLNDIFGWHSGWTADEVPPVKLSPGFPDIKALAEVLAAEPSEEALQKVLEKHPQIVTGFCGQGDDVTLGLLTKPPIGTQYRADFAVFTVNQGGCSVTLIEIEKSTHPLFTRKGSQSQALQSAITQTMDWWEWIRPNEATFVRDTLKQLKEAPQHPERSQNGGFRTFSKAHIDNAWRMFDGFENPYVNFLVIIGRWSELSESHKKRLIQLNRSLDERTRIRTYEQLARRAYDRPACFF